MIVSSWSLLVSLGPLSMPFEPVFGLNKVRLHTNNFLGFLSPSSLLWPSMSSDSLEGSKKKILGLTLSGLRHQTDAHLGLPAAICSIPHTDAES